MKALAMILVAGSANLDFVVRAPRIPRPGETVLGGEFQTYPGGKGANQAVACARAGGVATHMLLALGDDAYAVPLQRSLHDAQVQLHTVHATQPTGCAFICVSGDAENAITVAPGANLALGAQHLPALHGFSHLLMQLEIPLSSVLAYAQAARAEGLQVVLNAAPAQALPPALLGLTDLLIVNEGELAQLAGESGSIAECLQRVDVPAIVVTLGRHGCCAYQRGQWTLQTAFDVTAVDTTGAGDTFCGALVASLSQGHSMPSALNTASAAAALACTRMGAQSSIPSALEVQQFLQNNPLASGPAHAAGLASLRALCGLA